MNPKRAAVIGSGFGGLAAAIRMQAAGIPTTIFEARDLPGGRAYVYQDQGFTFDAGPTVITAPQCIEELFDVAGRKMRDYVELVPVAPFYRLIWEDGDTLDYVGDLARMDAQIARRNPADVKGYHRYLAYSEQVFNKGYKDLVAQPFLNFTDMLKVAPDLVRLGAHRPVFDTVSRYVKDPHLRQALSFHALLIGGNPFETSSIYTLITHLERTFGVFYPRGGTGALVQGLVKLFQDLGGTLRLNTPVNRVDVRERDDGVVHQVAAAGRPPEDFDLVISNADVHHTYGKIYGADERGARMARKLEHLDWSMSLFVLYFGTDTPYSDQVVHHSILFGPRYKELLSEIFTGEHLPDDFSLYLHAPHRTDPGMAPPGCGSFYVLSPVPHLGHANLDWAAEAPGYAEKILTHLERWLPDLRRHVVTKRWFTPEDFRTQLRSHVGSAFSCSPRLTQSAWFRPHNRDPKIPGLYIVGAGTHPGAGVPGVINSAKATTRVILEDLHA